MVHLFLSEPVWNNVGDNNDNAKLRKSLLTELESSIQSLLMSGGRSEARLWLCESMSGITSIARDDQRELFVKFLRSKPVKYSLASQLLQIIFDKKPEKIGTIISKRSYSLEKFFQGNPTRIMQWFSNFATSGNGTEHKKGAKALAQFAFVNRDTCWEELEWRGKHGQSPAVVATKPHYFLDLDVQRTVENFIEYVPEFWSSSEFSDSLKDGNILSIDTKFFLEYFIDLMYKENLRDAWDVVAEFLTEESFSYLCHRLLITLEERDLSKFFESLRGFLQPRIDITELKDFRNTSFLFEAILAKYSDCGSFDQVLLLNAVLTKKRELLRLLRDEGGDETVEEAKEIVAQICEIPDSENSLAPIIKECFKPKKIEAIKFLGIQSWALYYSMLEKWKAPESWELLFTKNAITFRRFNPYALLDDASQEESDPELDRGPSNKVKRGKKSRKKRKRKHNRDDRHDDEFVDFDSTNDGSGLQGNGGSWLLSTDGHSTTWSSMDLPEYLSQHCLSTWMGWISCKMGRGG